MQVYDLAKLQELRIFHLGDNRLIHGYYACDMLSWAMGHIREDGIVLITMISNINVIAVATLMGCAAIIFREGVSPTSEMITKAKEEGLSLFGGKKDALLIYEGIKAYEACL